MMGVLPVWIFKFPITLINDTANILQKSNIGQIDNKIEREPWCNRIEWRRDKISGRTLIILEKMDPLLNEI